MTALSYTPFTTFEVPEYPQGVQGSLVWDRIQWIYPYPRELGNESGEVTPVVSYTGGFTRVKSSAVSGKESYQTTGEPVLVETGVIYSSVPNRGIRIPSFPVWNPPKHRVRKAPKYRGHTLKALLRYERRYERYRALVDRDALRLRMYERAYQKRVEKFRLNKIRFRLKQKYGVRLHAGKPGKYIVRHPHVLYSFSGECHVWQYEKFSASYPTLFDPAFYPSDGYLNRVELDAVECQSLASAESLVASSAIRPSAKALASVFIPDGLWETVRNRNLKKIADRSLDLAVLLGEGKESVTLATDLVEKLVRLAREARRLRKSPRGLFSTFVGSAADFALAFNLGIKPLVQDARAVWDILSGATALGNPLVELRVQSRIVEEGVFDSPQGTLTGTRKAVETIFYKIENPLVHLAQQLGLTNPFASAWELIPFSFLIDWVLSVGQALERLSALDGVAITECWRTEYLEGSLLPTSGSILPARLTRDWQDMTPPDHPAWALHPTYGRYTTRQGLFFLPAGPGKVKIRVRSSVPFTPPALSDLTIGKGISHISRAVTAASLLTRTYQQEARVSPPKNRRKLR